MDRNKIIVSLASLFLVVIFISAYAFSNTNYNPSGPKQTTTVLPSELYFAVGYANATITGYGNVMYVNATCREPLANYTLNSLNNTLNTLENNNSIFSFYTTGRKVAIDAGTLNGTSLYNYLYSRLNASEENCSLFSVTALAMLPKVVSMEIQTQKFQVAMPNSSRNFSIPVLLNKTAVSKVEVKVSALLTQNATVYGNVSVSGA